MKIRFYRKNKVVSVDFSAGEISSDGAVVLLEKFEREHGLLRYFSKLISDARDPLRTVLGREKQLKQRVFMLMQGTRAQTMWNTYHKSL